MTFKNVLYYFIFFIQTPGVTIDKDEMVVTTSVLNFMLRGPKSVVVHENDDDKSTLVCRAFNPVIKTNDHDYVETKITLNVQCKLLIK